MRRLIIVFLLPMINASITVRVYRQALFYPNSSCSFICNKTLSNDQSMQTCIWQCEDEYDCQTVMYNHEKKICSMYGEDCQRGRIVFDGNIQNSVICNQKNHDNSQTMQTCTSTVTTADNAITSTSEVENTSSSVSQDIFWSFDENFDDLYNNYNGMGINNCSFSSPGYTGYGSALSLNLTQSQYVLVDKYLNLTNHSFTWEMWAYPTYSNGSGDYVLVGTCSSKTTDKCLYLMIRTNVSYFAFYNDDCSGTTFLNTRQWYHFAFVYDFENRTQYIYLNGNIECMRNHSGPYQGNSNVTLIGAIQLPTETVKYWSGYIDQVSYESRVKTPAEILSDATLVAYYSFDGGSFLDSGPNKINGTGVNVSSIAGRVNGGLLFNNSNAYFRASGFTLLGAPYRSYSFSLWIYRLESLNNTGGTIVHVSQSLSGANSWCIPFIGLSSSYQIAVQSYDTAGNLPAINGSLIPIGTWTHIAHSYSATNGIRLWINGTLIGSSSPFTYNPSGVPDIIIIGSSLNGSSYCYTKSIQMGQFYGIIDEVKVFSRELNQTDVLMLVNLL